MRTFWYLIAATLAAGFVCLFGIALVVCGAGFWNWISQGNWPTYTMDDLIPSWLPQWAFVSTVIGFLLGKPAVFFLMKVANTMGALSHTAIDRVERIDASRRKLRKRAG
jgi:hypothetical protein